MGTCFSVDDPHSSSSNRSSQGEGRGSSGGGDDGSGLGGSGGATVAGLRFHEHYSVGKQVRVRACEC